MPIVVYSDALEPGGSARYAVDLISGLRRAGYSVAVISRRLDRLASMHAQIRQTGAALHTFEAADRSARGRLGRLAELTAIVRRYRGCVLLLVMDYWGGGGPITIAGVLGRARAIVRADLQPPDFPFTWRERLAVGARDLIIDRVIVGAAENREAFANKMGRARRKFAIVHTGIELERFSPGTGRAEARESLGYRRETLVVGMISRIGKDSWRKGHHIFLEMAERLASKCPEAMFLIVGDGEHRAALEQQARAMGIADRVTFAGWRADIPAILAALDVFVMPSLFEGGPTTVLEAMAMGRSVVATAVGMVPEVVDPGSTGLVVPPADSAALTDAVEALLNDSDCREAMGLRARQKAMRDFPIDTMVERYLETLGDLVPPAPAPSRS